MELVVIQWQVIFWKASPIECHCQYNISKFAALGLKEQNQQHQPLREMVLISLLLKLQLKKKKKKETNSRKDCATHFCKIMWEAMVSQVELQYWSFWDSLWNSL